MPSGLKIAATLLVATLAPVASAQTTPPAPSAPPAWAIRPSGEGSAEISATAHGGAATFVGGCSRLAGPGFGGAFARYSGNGLQRIDGEIERVLFEVSGQEWKEAFSAQLRYSAATRSWELAKILAPVFVDSFSRGQTLAVVNGQRQEVFAFDLTGSTGAARAMRNACGFLPATG